MSVLERISVAALAEPGSGAQRLERSESEKREPVGMALACHHFTRALAAPLVAPAARVAPVIEEELHQA